MPVLNVCLVTGTLCEMDLDKTREWVRVQLDRLWEDRIDRAVTGARMSPAELVSTVAMARDDLAVSLRQQILVDTKPGEVKATVQAFVDLDQWVGDRGGVGAAKAAKLSASDINRVEKIMRQARGLDDA